MAHCPVRLTLVVGLFLALPMIAPGQPPQGNGVPPPDNHGRTDPLGDPLPAGASVRLGSARFQQHGLIGVAFSPDGKTMLALGLKNEDYGYALGVWDAATGKELARLEPDASRQVAGWAFSPQGKEVALLQRNKVNLIDWRSGKLLRSLGGEHDLTSFAISPDGSLLATGGREAKGAVIRVWEVASGRELHTLENAGETVNTLKFTPDGKRLVAVALAVQKVENQVGILVPGTVCVWDVAARKRLHERGHASFHVALAPDGKTVALEEKAGNAIRVKDIATDEERCRIAARHTSFAFTPDGKGLVAVDYEEGATLWDAATGKEQRRFRGMPGDTLRLGGISPDGKVLAVLIGDWRTSNAIRFWDVATGEEVRRTVGHQGGVNGLAYSPDGKVLASAGRDHTVRLWDPATGKELRILRGHKQAVLAVAFAPDGKTLASSGADGSTRLWEVATGKELAQLAGPAGGALALAFGADGKTLVAGGNGKAQTWNLTGNRKTWEAAGDSDHAVQGFGQDGRVFLSAPGGKDFQFAIRELGKDVPPESLHLRDTATGKLLLAIRLRDARDGYSDLICHSAAVSADGKLLVSSQIRLSNTLRGVQGSDWKVRLWERATGQEIWNTHQTANALAFSADSRLLAIAHGETYQRWTRIPDRSVSVCDTLTGERLRTFAGHTTPATCLAFSPDGKWLASGSSDQTILIWETVRPAVKPPAAKLTPKELEAWWQDLGGDAIVAQHAFREFLRCPEQAVPLLGERLQAVPAVDGKRIADLVKDLDHPRFAVRQQATVALEKLGDLAETALRQALAGSRSLEYRRRVEQLLDRLDGTPTPARLREWRALTALEWIGTAPARQVLKGLADGTPEARLTQEARASLLRLDRIGAAPK
jgi:WD40 repeat protein